MMLLEHAETVGKLLGKLGILEQIRAPESLELRQGWAEHLNCIDGEISFCQELADRRGLATRVNNEIGVPVIDGLTLRGLLYVLGGSAEIWRKFRTFVD